MLGRVLLLTRMIHTTPDAAVRTLRQGVARCRNCFAWHAGAGPEQADREPWGRTPLPRRYRKLSAALADVIEDFGLVAFQPLAIEDKDSVAEGPCAG